MSVEDAERALNESNKLMEKSHTGSARQVESLGAAVAQSPEGARLNKVATEQLGELKIVGQKEILDVVASSDETPEITVSESKPAEAAYVEAVARRADEPGVLTAADIIHEQGTTAQTNDEIDKAMESGMQEMDAAQKAEEQKKERAQAPAEVAVQASSKEDLAEVNAAVAREEATSNPVSVESFNNAMLKVIDERHVSTPAAVSREDLMQALGRTQLTPDEEGAFVQAKMLLISKMKEMESAQKATERGVAPPEVDAVKASAIDQAEVMEAVAAEETSERPVSYGDIEKVVSDIVAERGLPDPTAVSLDDVTQRLGRTALTKEEKGQYVKHRLNSLSATYRPKADKVVAPKIEAPEPKIVDVKHEKEESPETMISLVEKARGLLLSPEQVMSDDPTLAIEAATGKVHRLIVDMDSTSNEFAESEGYDDLHEALVDYGRYLDGISGKTFKAGVAEADRAYHLPKMSSKLYEYESGRLVGVLDKLSGCKKTEVSAVSRAEKLRQFGAQPSDEAMDMAANDLLSKSGIKVAPGATMEEIDKGWDQPVAAEKKPAVGPDTSAIDEGWDESAKAVEIQQAVDGSIKDGMAALPTIEPGEEFMIERTAHAGTENAEIKIAETAPETVPIAEAQKTLIGLGAVMQPSVEATKTLIGMGPAIAEKPKTLIGLAPAFVVPSTTEKMDLSSQESGLEVQTPANDIQESIEVADSSTESVSRAAGEEIELATSAEELAQERAAKERKRRLELFRTLGAEQWDDAYYGSEMPWTKTLWETLSSEVKNGEAMSEKQMFNTLRIAELENAKRMKELQDSLRELDRQIAARKTELRQGQKSGEFQLGVTGMHEQMSDLQTEANDPLLQKLEGQRKTNLLETRKVQEMTQMQKEQEGELLRRAQERLDKNQKPGNKTEPMPASSREAGGDSVAKKTVDGSVAAVAVRAREKNRDTVPQATRAPAMPQAQESPSATRIAQPEWSKKGPGYLTYGAAALGTYATGIAIGTGLKVGAWGLKLPFRAFAGSFQWAGKAMSGIDKGLGFFQKILTAENPGSALSQIFKETVGGVDRALEKSLSEEERKSLEDKRKKESEKQKKSAEAKAAEI